MKHASPAALDRIEPLLAAIRARPRVREKSRGVFYLGSKALLHFHEDPAGLFADLKVLGDWKRFDVTDGRERDEMLAELDAVLSDQALRRS
jgi:hypothetical protein